jgi:hypothetical protein
VADRLRKRARRMLEARYEEMEGLYLWHREAAERLIHESERFTPITLAHFAAGQASLEAAWVDRVISGNEHAWLLQVHTAIVSHSVDDYSECDAGFDVEISPPFGMLTEPDAVQPYLAVARAARSEATSRRTALVMIYKAAEWMHEPLASPYRVTATATILWAKSRAWLGRQTASRLDVYFEAMHILVEQLELGLPEIAGWLEQELEHQLRDGTPLPSPEAEPEDEWRDW